VIETAARGAQFLLAIGIAYVIAVWFALVAWTFRDIESRSKSVFTQVFSTLLVVLFFIPGLILYLILRPKETLDQTFQRALEEEYLLQDLDDLPLCPGCERAVDPDFVLCPHCQTRLRGPCPSCARLIDLRWSVCPYCATAIDKGAMPAITAESGNGVDAVGGRRKRAMAAAAKRVGIEAEDLDALTRALADSTPPAAVGTGSTGPRLTDRLSAIGEGARLRAGARLRLGTSDASASEDAERETLSGSAEAGHANGQDGPERFWADPLPGPGRPRTPGSTE
jgi:hypothetical protein